MAVWGWGWGDKTGVEDAQHSQAGDIRFCALQGQPGSCCCSPATGWDCLGLPCHHVGPGDACILLTPGLPGDRGVALPLSNVHSFLGEICLPLHQEFGPERQCAVPLLISSCDRAFFLSCPFPHTKPGELCLASGWGGELLD